MSQTNWRTTIAALLVALAPLGPAPAWAQAVINVPNEDPAMEAAQAKARAGLPEFWKALDKPAPGERMFTLKVSVPIGGNNTEHIWVSGIERLKNGRLSGRLDNVPRDIKDKKSGDRIEFETKDISDWMFVRNGKIVGNETLRPLLSRMSKEQAGKYRAMLEKP